MDITNSIISWLEGLGVDAYHTVPASRPDSFAVVDMAGNPTEAVTLRRSTLSVTLWDVDAQRMRDTAYTIGTSRYLLMEQPRIFGTQIVNEYEDYDHEGDVFLYVIVLQVLYEEQ